MHSITNVIPSESGEQIGKCVCIATIVDWVSSTTAVAVAQEYMMLEARYSNKNTFCMKCCIYSAFGRASFDMSCCKTRL